MRKSKEVEVWFARYDNPMKDVVARIREIILAADPRISECIKWQAPTFVFEGNLASFFPKSKQHASLMFHTGAHIPGKFPRLEGGGDTSRVMKIGSLAEADAARRELEQIVRAWCNWRAAKTPPTGAKNAGQARCHTSQGGEATREEGGQGEAEVIRAACGQVDFHEAPLKNGAGSVQPGAAHASFWCRRASRRA